MINRRKLQKSIELLQKAEKMALQLDPENGFHLAFSGGKDSQALYHVAKMAGVKFKAHMSFTTVDPPEVIRFVKKNYPDVELIKPKMSIYEMAKQKGFLPTQKIRWCCAAFKETHGAGTITLLGIRHEESVRRKKRKEFEVNREYAGNFDQWNIQHENVVSCINGTDKIMLSPIIDWTEREVWAFLNYYNIPYCSLYDKGYNRIGCILCPMSSYNQKIREIRDFPHVKKKWIDTIKWLSENKWKKKKMIETPEITFKWWISGKKYKKFYADEFLQQKIDF